MWMILFIPLRLMAQRQSWQIVELTKINRMQVVEYASSQLTTTANGVTTLPAFRRGAHVSFTHLFWARELPMRKVKVGR